MELFSSLNAKPKNSLSEKKLVDKVSKSAENSNNFIDLGLSQWICDVTKLMGYKRPSEIQKKCIPGILDGKDILACAETGSGKTAAFALPILHSLSKDPFGIYAIVITPTRELAIQIAEQFSAFGAGLNLKVSLVIGGMNIIQQGLELAKRPHVVIATPGRLRHHLESADPPNISKAKFLVLDEADRLLSAGFSNELEVIFEKMNPKRQTLLFSATLTSSLIELENLSLKNALRVDLTISQKIPSTLQQNYILMSSKIKSCYLVAVLKKFNVVNFEQTKQKIQKDQKKKDKKNKNDKLDINDNNDKQSALIMIFVSTCKRCQELSETLNQLELNCVSLHSMQTQSKRIESLNSFKNQISRILVATDVASRGLDIPEVDLVINFDLPKICSDYVHRIGRTARAGRYGRAISFVTQNDIELLKSIESFIQMKLTPSEEIKEDEILPLLNPISKAIRTAKMNLLDNGFEEKVKVFKQRKRKQRRLIEKSIKKSKLD